MSFLENLKQKMEVGRLSTAVRSSLVASDGMVKINKEAAAKLLLLAGFKEIKKRDLTLFHKGIDETNRTVVVLDGELGCYQSSIEDVVTRKSPTVKEMISFRNAIRILKDNDVVVSKKGETVATLVDLISSSLDFSFTKEDISEIMYSGIASLDGEDSAGVEEYLSLMAELLSWESPPAFFGRYHQRIIGEAGKDSTGLPVFGPAVTYDRVIQGLYRTNQIFRVGVSDDKLVFESFVAGGGGLSPDMKGESVIRYLADLVLSGIGPYGSPKD